jgi:hypothetical protein
MARISCSINAIALAYTFKITNLKLCDVLPYNAKGRVKELTISFQRVKNTEKASVYIYAIGNDGCTYRIKGIYADEISEAAALKIARDYLNTIKTTLKKCVTE